MVYHTGYSSKIMIAKNNPKLFPDDLKQLYLAMCLKTMYNRNIIDEGSRASDDAKTIVANGHLGDLPIRILTAESDPEWNNSQVALKNWSTDSVQISVKGAEHSIHISNPDVVNDEIIKLIKN